MAEPQLITRYKADNSDLTRKTKEAERALEQFGVKGTEVGKKINQLTGIMNTNVGSLSALSLGLGAAGAALKVAKDAFNANEQYIDDWERAVHTAQSSYETFLTSINTGDVSGFLSRIGEVTKAANAAYDAMDRLGTQKAINNKAYQEQNTENERIRAMIRTGRYISPNDGRTASMANGTVLSDKQIEGLKKQLENGMDKLNTIVQSEISTTTNAISALYDEQASVLGVSKSTFLKTTQSMESFEDAINGYKKYIDFEAAHTTVESSHSYSQFGGGSATYNRDNVANPYEQYKNYKWTTVFKDDGELFSRINELINQRASLQTQNYSSIASGYKALNKTTGGAGGGKKRDDDPAIDGTIRFYQEMIADLNKQIGNTVDAEVRDKLSATVRAAQEELNRLKTGDRTWSVGHDKVAATQTADIKIESAAANMDLSGVEEAARRWKEYQESIKRAHETNLQAASSIGMLGSALQGIEDPAIKTFGIIAEAVANVTLAFAKSLKGTMTPWDFIAGAAAGLATVISTVSAIKSINSGSYADGGIIPGSRYSGDMLTANVNAGELILNRAQQGNLASQLNGVADNGSRDVEFHIASDELVGILRQHANIKSYR